MVAQIAKIGEEFVVTVGATQNLHPEVHGDPIGGICQRKGACGTVPAEFSDIGIGQIIAGTSYSYTHSLLLEAGIINDIEVNHSVLNGGMSEFLESIINYYE